MKNYVRLGLTLMSVMAVLSCGKQTVPDTTVPEQISESISHDGMDHTAVRTKNPTTDHGTAAPSPEDKGANMKALFGPDYKKGDIGHSTGDIISVSGDKSYVTIKHGVIHGINIGAMTMGYERLETAKVAGLAEGDTVEFLVKKGADNEFRIFLICKMASEADKCLGGRMGGKP